MTSVWKHSHSCNNFHKVEYCVIWLRKTCWNVVIAKPTILSFHIGTLKQNPAEVSCLNIKCDFHPWSTVLTVQIVKSDERWNITLIQLHQKDGVLFKLLSFFHSQTEVRHLNTFSKFWDLKMKTFDIIVLRGGYEDLMAPFPSNSIPATPIAWVPFSQCSKRESFIDYSNNHCAVRVVYIQYTEHLGGLFLSSFLIYQGMTICLAVLRRITSLV